MLYLRKPRVKKKVKIQQIVEFVKDEEKSNGKIDLLRSYRKEPGLISRKNEKTIVSSMKVVLVWVLLVPGLAFAQIRNTVSKEVKTYAQWKNVPIISYLMGDKYLNELLKSDPFFANIAVERRSALVSGNKENQLWSTIEIDQAAKRLSVLLKNDPKLSLQRKALQALFDKYALPERIADAEKLEYAFRQDAAVLNYIISIYGFGKKPNYPAIDSISFDVRASEHPARVFQAGLDVVRHRKEMLFFEPSLKLAMNYLKMNGRLNAGFYEPMCFGVNKKAAGFVVDIDWSKYAYTHILVPGIGPDDLSVRISPGGKEHCRLAVEQYRLGLAPFMIVSGGNAHPFKTPYNEAEEMKRFMMDSLGVPEKAIIMEPHARHTTTNLRNAARLVFTYGLPTDKPGLIVTDRQQSAYIDKMEKRCLRELGYVPYRLGNRISATASEYYPLRISFRIDPDEPLDP